MIASVRQSGTLELFWRHPVSRNPARLAVERFLLGLPNRAQVMQSIETFRFKRTGLYTNGYDEDHLKALAADIVNRNVIVLHHKSEVRWHDTQASFAKLPKLLFLSRRRTDQQYDLNSALTWLEKPDGQEIHTIWETLWLRYGRDHEPNVSVGNFVEQAERLLNLGELVPVFHRRTGTDSSEVAETPMTPQAAAATPAAAPIEEGATFDPNHAPGSQAQALISAAESGVPFCEVCAREAAKRGMA